jgi:hypothetical protein
MGGGRGIPTLIFTCAIVGIGTTIANTKRIVPKNNVFIFCLLYPSSQTSFDIYRRKEWEIIHTPLAFCSVRLDTHT